MQVVYSGGSTPSPSPHLNRKAGYDRPNVPRYVTHVHPQIFVQRSREKLTEGDIVLRNSIPFMGTCTAVICLLLNIILPGSGTLTAGLSVLCCSQVRPKGGSKGHCILVNAGVGLLQFLLTFVFLLGWIWSIMWGVAFLKVSKNYSRCILQQETKRSPPKHMQRIRNKVPHKSSQLRKVSTSMTNRPTIENSKECNIHNHTPKCCHLHQYEHHTKQCQENALKNMAPEAFSFNDVSIAPSDTSSLIIPENSPTAATNSDVSPQECSLPEAAPETVSLQQSAVLQSQLHGHKSASSSALSDLADNRTHHHTRTRRGILIPSKTIDCSPPMAHRQTVVFHNHSAHTSYLDVCQKTRKPYQVCLSTVLK